MEDVIYDAAKVLIGVGTTIGGIYLVTKLPDSFDKPLDYKR